MTLRTHRPDPSVHRRMHGEDAGEFAATWFIFAAIVLSAALIFLVYSGGPELDFPADPGGADPSASLPPA